MVTIAALVSSVTAADAVGRAPWSIQTTPRPPGFRDGILNSVSCRSATACTAVGGFQARGRRPAPLVERWNGRAWSLQPAETLAAWRDSAFYDVSCPSPSACVAVGEYTNRWDTTLPLVERWNGLRWSVQGVRRPRPPRIYYAVLSGVSCASAASCTAVGETEYGTLVERWAGSRWSMERIPKLPADTSSLLSVSCAARTACVAVGNYADSESGNYVPLVERWNGTAWSRRSIPTVRSDESALVDASCSSRTVCTTVGFDGLVPLVARGEAGRWWFQTTPSLKYLLDPWGSEDAEFHGVSCSGPHACVAVGFVASDLALRPLVEGWNGKRWARQSTPGRPRAVVFQDVACNSKSACVAVGYDDSAASPVVERRW